MASTHPALVIGIAVDGLLAIGGWAVSPVLGATMVVAWILSFAGLLLMARGKHQIGRRLILVGSVAFVPIGLIAVWGATSIIDRSIEREFNSRRGVP